MLGPLKRVDAPIACVFRIELGLFADVHSLERGTAL